MSTTNRVIKAKLPARVIVTATLIALFAVGFIVLATWQSGVGIAQARMSGTIVSKEFQPFAKPEREITLNRSGDLSAADSEGQYILTVTVPMSGGSKKDFTVWLNDKHRYDAVKVGDKFDVGPYLVPSSPSK